MTNNTETVDCVVVGAGIVGLSVAEELARAELSVTLVDRQAPGREASWAAAGMLPPGSIFTDDPAIEQLAQISRPLHAELSDRVREHTGVDDEYTVCGGLYLCENQGEQERLTRTFARWAAFDIPSHRVDLQELSRLAPALSATLRRHVQEHGALLLPGEAQVRTPRRLKGLAASCAAHGVAMRLHDEVKSIEDDGAGVRLPMTAGPPIAADRVCFATGAWCDKHLRMAGERERMKPIRGQALLVEDPSGSRRLSRIVHHGPYYVVPRRDGRVVVGSTMEDVGFDKSTTADACARMLQFVSDVGLGDLVLTRHWAGLRPATDDALPLIGFAPGRPRVCFAAGLYRAGIQLAPATALLVRELLLGQTLSMDLSPFRLDR